MPKKPATTKFQLVMPNYQHRELTDLAKRAGRPKGALCGDIVSAFHDFVWNCKTEHGLRYDPKSDGQIISMALTKLSGGIDDESFYQFMQGLRPKGA